MNLVLNSSRRDDVNIKNQPMRMVSVISALNLRKLGNMWLGGITNKKERTATRAAIAIDVSTRWTWERRPFRRKSGWGNDREIAANVQVLPRASRIVRRFFMMHGDHFFGRSREGFGSEEDRAALP